MENKEVKVWKVTYLNDNEKKKKKIKLSGDDIQKVIFAANLKGIPAENILEITFYGIFNEDYYKYNMRK